MQTEDLSVMARVRDIVAKQIGKSSEDIGIDESLAILGIESLDVVEVMFALEEEFGIDIPLNANGPDGLPMDSVRAVTRSVTALLNAKG